MRHHLAEDIARVLTEHGLTKDGPESPGYDIHSWRCHYYRDLPGPKGGPCDCFDELVLSLVDVVNRRRPLGCVVAWSFLALALTFFAWWLWVGAQ